MLAMWLWFWGWTGGSGGGGTGGGTLGASDVHTFLMRMVEGLKGLAHI